jgi:chromosome segregation protein
LSAGVTIMARPPGKKISTIHLMSGGEKALTAVALVFSIFELNPAPFCLLDEVDAPLDDANVGRFSEIVREMSGRVQFVLITHNKTTMEAMNQLAGVTMQEPGVSRLVAVDIDEAVQLAAM